MNKKSKKALLGGMLALTLATGGVLAYLTDMENTTNTFKVGKVDIQLTEPNWKPDENTEITPNRTMTKDPTVTNVGINDAFIYVETEIPYATVRTATLDGIPETTATEHELFVTVRSDGKDGINDGWVQLSNTKDDAKKVYKHVYAYVGNDAATLEAVAEGEKVTPFNKVRFINVLEGQNLEEQTLNIFVTAKAIQTDDILVTENGITDPAQVLNIFNNQRGLSN